MTSRKGNADVNLSAMCPTCGEPKGSRCRNSKGVAIPPSMSHKRRKEIVYTTLNPEGIKAALGMKWQEDSTGALVNTESSINGVTQDSTSKPEYANEAEMDAAEAREGRIESVLWGFSFCRVAMKMHQDDLDRRIAEMIVDGEVIVSW